MSALSRSAAAAGGGSDEFNVRAFGAAGDGCTYETQALQAAIDACAGAGGGTVLVPAGVYITGTLMLRSHVTLHLCAGARLLGSARREDYNPDDAFPENQVFSRENVTGAHLVIGYRVKNAAITGRGMIDGNSGAFFDALPEGKTASYRYKNANFPVREWRPGQMVFFCRCEDISVSGVSLVDSPYWTLFFLGCDRVRVNGVTITNPPATPNGDGIDIDCCSNATVSDCIVYSGDDSITLRGNPRSLPEPKPCENVTVTNCVLASPCNAVRVGVGDGTVRNCRLSNLVIAEGRTGINMVSRYSDSVPRGTCIEGIRFSAVTMSVVVPLQVIVGAGARSPAGIRDVSFCGFQVAAEAGGYLGGNDDLPLRNIEIRDWDLHLADGSDNTDFHSGVPFPYRIFGHHGRDGMPSLPAALYAVHAEDLSLSAVRLHWAERLGAVWRDGLMFEHVVGARIAGCSLRQPRPGAGSAIRCVAVGGLAVADCSASPGTTTFLEAAQCAENTPVALIGNHLLEAAEPWRVDGPVRETANLC